MALPQRHQIGGQVMKRHWARLLLSVALLQLTAPGGNSVFVIESAIVSVSGVPSMEHAAASAKIGLSNGDHLFVRENPREVCWRIAENKEACGTDTVKR
jgi:uncharacterized protein YlzI (FlbEa/FlbD family)